MWCVAVLTFMRRRHGAVKSELCICIVSTKTYARKILHFAKNETNENELSATVQVVMK